MFIILCRSKFPVTFWACKRRSKFRNDAIKLSVDEIKLTVLWATNYANIAIQQALILTFAPRPFEKRTPLVAIGATGALVAIDIACIAGVFWAGESCLFTTTLPLWPAPFDMPNLLLSVGVSTWCFREQKDSRAWRKRLHCTLLSIDNNIWITVEFSSSLIYTPYSQMADTRKKTGA